MTLPSREPSSSLVPVPLEGPRGPKAMQILHDEATRQAQLDQMKGRATMLLIAATILFVITRAIESRYPWIGIVRATMDGSSISTRSCASAIVETSARP